MDNLGNVIYFLEMAIYSPYKYKKKFLEKADTELKDYFKNRKPLWDPKDSDIEDEKDVGHI